MEAIGTASVLRSTPVTPQVAPQGGAELSRALGSRTSSFLGEGVGEPKSR